MADRLAIDGGTPVIAEPIPVAYTVQVPSMTGRLTQLLKCCEVADCSGLLKILTWLRLKRKPRHYSA